MDVQGIVCKAVTPQKDDDVVEVSKDDGWPSNDGIEVDWLEVDIIEIH